MLKIFDKNHNAIGRIVKYKDCKIESELSTGDKTLYFTYLASHHNLTNEMYVQTRDDEFVIKEVPGTTGSFPQIVAVLNLEDLQKDMWKTFSVTDVTIDEAVRTVLAGTGWTIGECNVTKRRNAGMIQVSSLEVIQNLCKAFMCEPIFDTINKKVSFYVQRGEDKGVYFMSGLNLKKLQKKSISYDYYTRIIPIGANGLTIESVNDGKNYLENYQYSNKELTYIWKDESYTDVQALKDDAELKLNDLSKPTLSYSADVRDLAKQKTEYAILSYGLGDDVILIDRETGTRDKQRIVKLVEYPQNPEKNTCELANTVLTFEEMQKKVQDAANIINYTIAGDGRYTGTINVSDILHFEHGVAGSTTVSGINSSISSMKGDLAQVKMKIGEIDANYIKADEADLKYATIESLNVTNETVHSIQGDYASFKSTVTDELSATTADITNLTGRFATFEQTTTDELITAKGWMAEGSIGSAQISSVDANKIRSGTIDTALVTVVGTEGRLRIADNTIQISDANRVRVQVGKDASNDYTLAVWDSSGNLIWDALGATENTIQRKIIRDKMVADDAAIQALKLDLQSFNTAMTNQGVTISGTVVQVGNKTLNVALTEQTQLLTEHGEKLTDHATRIEANENAISLRVTTQVYESYKSTVDGEIASAKSRLYTAESSITAMNGQIALKVEQTDIDSAVKKVDDKFANYSTTSQMQSAINQKAGSITLSVSKTYATKEENQSTLSTANAAQSTANEANANASNAQKSADNVAANLANNYSTTVQMNSAIEQKSNSIISSVSATYQTKDAMGNYSTTAQMNSVIEQKANSIKSEVSATYATNATVGEVKTIAEQTADKFTWIVKSGTSATNFTLTDRTATLIAETISLNGNVKVNGNMLVSGSVTTDHISSGSITTSKLAANAVTAEKINTTDLFAQDITATGTIRGVKLVGFTGTMGGWSFSSNTISCKTATGSDGDYGQIILDAESASIKTRANVVPFNGKGYVEIKKYSVYADTISCMAFTADSNKKTTFNGSVSATTFSGNLYGNALTATKLSTARTISLTGSVTGSGSYDGSGDLSIATTTNHTHRTLINNNGDYGVGMESTSQKFIGMNAGKTTNGVIIIGSSGARFKEVWCTAGSLNSTSDRNLKANINPFDSRYESMYMDLQPVTFMYKNFTEYDNHDRIHFGLIAQDVEENLKNHSIGVEEAAFLCIDTLDKPNAAGEVVEYSMRYGELTSLNIHMIQKAHKRIDELEEKNSNLRAMVESLEYQLQQSFMRIATLEKQLQAA